MGDAKRRKQLGLMPSAVPFEVLADHEGTLTPVRLPADETQRRQITETLRMVTPGGAGWDQLYRTHYVQAGLPEERLITRKDVEKIAVPPRRRFVGELVTWPAGTQPPTTDGYFPVEGSEQHLAAPPQPPARLREQRLGWNCRKRTTSSRRCST